jgi:hypothetical protein
MDGGRVPSTRELYDALSPLPGFRADVIEGNLVLTPLGPPEHADRAMELYRALIPTMDAHDWKGRTGNVCVCIEGPQEPVEPDFVPAPADCPRREDRELLSSGLIMIAENVTPGIAPREYHGKLSTYANGRVPIYLLIDGMSEPPSVAVYSDFDDGVYRTRTETPMGKPLRLPHPVDFELDTSIFMV